MSSIIEWIKYQTGVWNEEHEKLVIEIAEMLLWYKPSIRKRILKKVEGALDRVKKKQSAREQIKNTK